MAERWIDYFESHTPSESKTPSENEHIATTTIQKSSIYGELIMETPRLLLPNPLLNKVRRRPAQLDLSASATAPSYTQEQNLLGKSLSDMSVREKLLLGVSMSMLNLQRNPALFDKIFPPPPSAIPPHVAGAIRHRKPACSPKRKLIDLHDTEMEMLDEEEREARRFERRMFSV